MILCYLLDGGGSGVCEGRGAWGDTRLADGQSWQTTDNLETSQSQPEGAITDLGRV